MQKKSNGKRVFPILFILMLIFISFTVFIPSSVADTTYSTNFENGTLTEQYSNSWLDVDSHCDNADSYITDAESHSGVKSYRVQSTECGDTKVHFNFTISEGLNITNASFWVKDWGGVDDTLIDFCDADGNAMISFKIVNDGLIYYNRCYKQHY